MASSRTLKSLDKYRHKLSCKIFPKICKIRLVKFKNLRYNEFSLSKLRGVTSAKSKISVGGVASQLGSSGAAVYTERSRLPWQRTKNAPAKHKVLQGQVFIGALDAAISECVGVSTKALQCLGALG